MNTSDTEKKLKAAYIYCITFGNKINSPKSTIPSLLLRQGIDSEFTKAVSNSDNKSGTNKQDTPNNDSGKNNPSTPNNGEGTNDSDTSQNTSVTYTMRLRGVKVNRKIYQPTAIEAELDISQKVTTSGTTTGTPSFKDVKDLLLYRQVHVETLHANTDSYTNQIINEGLSCDVATNCYVYEVTPQLKHDTNGTKMYVKLSIFSMDKLMTLNPYSKAYVARKLGLQILQSESQNFGLGADDYPLVATDISSLQHLTYDSDKKEYIHPYLVQYNESFYDFLVRTANRLGEFLFFEKGKLTLGLPDSGDSLVVDTFETVTAQEIAEGPLNIIPYARDSVKDDNSLKDKDNKLTSLNQYLDRSREKDYPKDAFSDYTTSNAEYAIDEYFYPLYKDNFTSQNREMYYDGDATEVFLSTTLPIIGNIFSNENDWKTGITKTITTALANTALGNIDAAIAVAKTKAKQNDVFFPDNSKDEMYDGDSRVQFSTLDTSAWTTVKHLNEIRRCEATVQREMICINMGTNYMPVRLGQKIKIAGMDTVYIVIQIQQTSEDAWQRNYDRYDQVNNDTRSSKRTQLIYAIPPYDKDNKYYYPPVHPVPMVRKAGPQVAFVTDNNDPKYQGRVRIAYPWQTLKPSLKNDLRDTNTKLEEVQSYKQSLENEKKKLQEEKVWLEYLEAELYQKYKNLTPEQRQKEGEKEKTDIDFRISSLKTDNEAIDNAIKEHKEKIKTVDKEIKEIKEDPNKTETDVVSKEAEKVTHLNEITKLQTEQDQNNQQIQTLERKKSYIDAGITDCDKAIENIETERDTINARIKTIDEELEKKRDEINLYEDQKSKIEKYIDKDIKAMSSPWIRIATPMATPGGGAFFRPYVGDEVLVNYDNDNIERPYVVGSFYSKNVLTPDEGITRAAAPELQRSNVAISLMSANGHHVTFTDPKTGDQFFYNLVSPGMGTIAKLAGFDNGAKDAKDLAGGIHIGDRYGLYEINMMSHKRTIDIKSPFGNININAFTGITISAPNGDVTIQGKNVTIEAGNKLTLLSGKNVEDFEKTKGLTAGGAIWGGIAQAGKDALQKVTNKYLFSIIDLTYIRHVAEVFVRPIDGTMLLKSKRFLMLEAGKGTANILSERYNEKGLAKTKNERTFEAIQTCMNILEQKIDDFFTQYEVLWKDGYAKREAYKTKMKKVLKPENGEDDNSLMTTANTNQAWTDALVVLGGYQDKMQEDLKDNAVVFSSFKSAADNFGKAAVAAIQHAKGYNSIIPNVIHGAPYTWLNNETVNAFKTAANINGNNTPWTAKYTDIKTFLQTKDMPDGDPFHPNKRLQLKRKVLLQFIKNVNTYFGVHQEQRVFTLNAVAAATDAQLTNNGQWNNYVQELFKKQEKSKAAVFADVIGAKKWYEKNILPLKALDRDIWSDTVHGQILFSDKEDGTLHFENEGLRRFPNVSEAGLKNHLLTIS